MLRVLCVCVCCVSVSVVNYKTVPENLSYYNLKQKSNIFDDSVSGSNFEPAELYYFPSVTLWRGGSYYLYISTKWQHVVVVDGSLCVATTRIRLPLYHLYQDWHQHREADAAEDARDEHGRREHAGRLGVLRSHRLRGVHHAE